MFGISWAETLLIAIIAIVVIGPEKLPEVARAAGRGVRQLRRLMHRVHEYVQMDELVAAQQQQGNPPPLATTPTATPDAVRSAMADHGKTGTAG
jgi:Tat protein translocase TatB subunit